MSQIYFTCHSSSSPSIPLSHGVLYKRDFTFISGLPPIPMNYADSPLLHVFFNGAILTIQVKGIRGFELECRKVSEGKWMRSVRETLFIDVFKEPTFLLRFPTLKEISNLVFEISHVKKEPNPIYSSSEFSQEIPKNVKESAFESKTRQFEFAHQTAICNKRLFPLLHNSLQNPHSLVETIRSEDSNGLGTKKVKFDDIEEIEEDISFALTNSSKSKILPKFPKTLATIPTIPESKPPVKPQIQQIEIIEDENICNENVIRKESIEAIHRKASEFIEENQRKSKRLQKLKTIDDSCAICLNSLKDVDIWGFLPCRHRFCFQCIHEWSKVTNLCPICKRDFNRISKRECGVTQVVEVEKRKQKIEEAEIYEIDDTCDDICYLCGESNDFADMIICDNCGYLCAHFRCCGLDSIPVEDWICHVCDDEQWITNNLESSEDVHN